MTPLSSLWMVLLIAACAAGGAALNPTVAQLEQAKTLAQAGDDAALTRMPVTCAPQEAGCAQLHAVRAGACRRGADFDCAIAEYRAALAASRLTRDTGADPATLQLALLESAHARRDAARGAAALRANETLGIEAGAAQADPATRTAGYFYAANASLFAALRTPAPGGCADIARARADLARAGTDGTDFAANGQALEQAIANAQRARGCGS